MKLAYHIYGVIVTVGFGILQISVIASSFFAGMYVFRLCKDPYVAAIGGLLGLFIVVAIISQCALWLSRRSGSAPAAREG